MDPNERVPGRERWINEVDDFPETLPSGVTRDAKVWYGFEYVTRDGRKKIQWFRRGGTGKPGTETPDRVEIEQDAGIVPSVAKEYEAARKKEEEEADNPTVRNINGVPHERTPGPDGKPVWTPVQTATGPAQPSAGTQKPAGSTSQIEGTPDPSKPGGFDNGRPRLVTRGPDGALLSAEPLTAAQRDQWERDKNQGAGVGSYTDKEVADRGQKQQPATKQDTVPGYPGWTYRTDKDAQGNELTVYFPPGSNTPQRSLPEKPTAPDKPQQSITTITGGDGQPYTRVVTVGADGKPSIATYGPSGQPVASVPGEKEQPKVTQVRGEDGQVYTTITTIGPDNRVSVQTVDQRGNPVEKIPTKADKPDKSELREVDGELMEIIRDPQTGTIKEMRPAQRATSTGNAGPPLPRVVVGMSVGALTDYKDQLAQEVAAGRQTQAWANARWTEANQLANYAVGEATLLQREYETNLNANVNIAQSKLSHLDSGMKSALQFVLAINDKLPPNSPLGGKAFSALLGLNAINMARSGINDIKVGPVDTRGIVERGRASAGGGGTGTVPPPRPRVANPANGEAIEAQRQQAIADLRRETGVSNTTDAGGAPRESTPTVQVGPGHATPSWERGGAPVPPAAPAAAVPAAPAVAAPSAPAAVSPTGQTMVPGPQPAGAAPPSGEQIDILNPVSGQRLTVPAANIGTFVGPSLGWERVTPATGDPGFHRPDMQASPTGDPGFYRPDMQGPPTGDPGFHRVVDPPPQASTPDLAVLANYRPQQQEAQMQTPPQAPPPMSMPEQPQIQIPEQQPIQVDPSGGEPLALIKQRLLSVPPWRLSDQDYALAQQYGLESDFWAKPRVGMAV
jgi:hypothetical protein